MKMIEQLKEELYPEEKRIENHFAFDRATARALIGWLKEGKRPITYTQLAEIVSCEHGGDVAARGFFDSPLDRIQAVCSNYGLPSIASIVRYKETMGPSKGFLVAYNHRYHAQYSIDDLDMLSNAEMEKSFKQRSWRQLARFYSLGG